MTIITSLKNLRHVFLILIFLLIFFIMLNPPQDADMWWHLAAGRAMVEQGRILTTDIFSYTHYGEPWTNAFWIADILLFLAHRLGGYLGLTLLVALTAVITMGIIYHRTLPNPFPLPLLILLLATFAISPVWTPRPQIFSFLLLAILDYGLNENNGFLLRRPWLLVMLFIVWANTHGGFIWGFLLLFAFIVGNVLDNLLQRGSLSFQQFRQLTIWTLIAALAIAINPNGISLWKLPFYTVGVSIQSITEWSSPDFHRLDLHPLLWLLFLLIIGAGTSKESLRWSSMLKVIGFSYMAFVSQRSIGPFVIVVAPIIIHSLTDAWSELLSTVSRIYKPRPSSSAPTIFTAILNIIILGIFIVLTLLRAVTVSSEGQVHDGLPKNAVEWIRVNHPEGRMFNAYNWGGYLQWELPEHPVFIDGRADLYGEQTINDWWRIVNATEEGVRLLDQWQVNFVILEQGWPILERLAQHGWHILYEDDIAIVIGR